MTIAAAGSEPDWAGRDLHWLVRRGLDRGQRLLTAGELCVARRICALPPGPAGVYARLVHRVPEVFAVEHLVEAAAACAEADVEALLADGLVDRLVPWPARARALPARTLAEAAAGLGLRRSGRKAELVERLAEHSGWCGLRWIRVRHRALVRRLERWALLRRYPDAGTRVAERLGHVRWPSYAVSSHAPLYADRGALLRWEALLEHLDELDPHAALDALSEGSHRAPGRLDLGGPVARRVAAAAYERVRDGRADEALELYARLERDAGVSAPSLAVAVARAAEASGQAAVALEHLGAHRRAARPHERIAIARTGRRLARSLGRGWPPDRPLQRPPRRSVRLASRPTQSARKRWVVGGATLAVEPAVVQTLALHGRGALWAEGAVWRTLFALLFADCYFLPVPGALPVRYLAGPLDLGTPAFRARRAAAVDAVLDAVDAGEGPERVRAAHAQWAGTRLAGAAWSLADADVLGQIADGIRPRGLRAVLERMLDEGWHATRGLPDLVVLAGSPCRIPGALPSRVPGHLLLAEVKGPGDTVRDEQSAWFDVLLRAGARVEVWAVSADPSARPEPPVAVVESGPPG